MQIFNKSLIFDYKLIIIKNKKYMFHDYTTNDIQFKFPE